jgi:hypothetical protein
VTNCYYEDNITDAVNIQKYYCEFNQTHYFDTKINSKVICDLAIIILQKSKLYLKEKKNKEEILNVIIAVRITRLKVASLNI